MTRIITIITLISLTLFSCEKANEKEMQNDLQHQQSSIQSEMSDLEIRINNFLEDMENEEEGSLSLDSAIYYLEAGFNYRYANSGRDEELVATQVDTSYVDIQIDAENMCSYTSMNESYADIYLVMENIFNNLSFDDKALNILDISSQQTETGIRLRLISFWKFGGFSMSGDWIWGLDGGKCDGTFQSLLDATDAIERRYEVTGSSLPYGIWTDIDMTAYYYANESLMTQNAPTNTFGYFTSLLFYYEKTSMQTICLLHDEIGFYVDRVPEIINRIKNDEGISTTIKSIDIESDLAPTGGNKYPILHTARLIFGNFEPDIVSPGYDDFLSI